MPNWPRVEMDFSKSLPPNKDRAIFEKKYK